MEELQYLTEKDMEYFEELEEHGEAIIIRLDPEQLIALDLSELFDKDKKISLDMDSVQEWLKSHGMELKEKCRKNKEVDEENRQIEAALNNEPDEASVQGINIGLINNPEGQERVEETLVSRLQRVHLDEAQANIINKAIQAGIEENQILTLLMDGMTAEKMQTMFDIFVSIREKN